MVAACFRRSRLRGAKEQGEAGTGTRPTPMKNEPTLGGVLFDGTT
jgi:hypothetical protein